MSAAQKSENRKKNLNNSQFSSGRLCRLPGQIKEPMLPSVSFSDPILWRSLFGRIQPVTKIDNCIYPFEYQWFCLKVFSNRLKGTWSPHTASVKRWPSVSSSFSSCKKSSNFWISSQFLSGNRRECFEYLVRNSGFGGLISRRGVVLLWKEQTFLCQ